MRYFVAAVLIISLIAGIQNHGSSMAIPVSAADSNCGFKNGSNDTEERAKALNGYNVCLSVNYFDLLLRKRPYPQTKITDSLERAQLTEKLLRFNDPNKIAYITLLSDYGTVIATYTIKGKVSSNQSQLSANRILMMGGGEGGRAEMEAPSDDGSYGQNEDGIFFFTTAGVLKQWNGKYLLSDAPEQVTAAPIITYNIEAKPTTPGIDIR